MIFGPLPPWPTLYLRTGIIAFVLAALLTPVGIFILRRLNVLDPVARGKIHEKPTPRGGGIVIFFAFAIAVLLPNYRDNPMKGVMAGSFICLVVGAIDDFRGGVPAAIKFAALVAATLVMAYFGVRLTLFQFLPLDLLLTLLWIVGVTSAFNGIDNMDGLAAGVAVIVSAMYLTIALQSYQAAAGETSLAWFGLLAVGLIGANLGFLLYNFKPARIFMGDSGSFSLGFMLSALGVMGEWNENRVIASTIPILILGVPLFDFAYIILVRILRGETRTLLEVIEHCAPDHLSHRLAWIGLSQRKAVMFIYLICFVLGVSGILLRNSDTLFDSAIALLQGVSIVFIIIILMAGGERRHLASMRRQIDAERRSAQPPETPGKSGASPG